MQSQGLGGEMSSAGSVALILAVVLVWACGCACSSTLLPLMGRRIPAPAASSQRILETGLMLCRVLGG